MPITGLRGIDDVWLAGDGGQSASGGHGVIKIIRTMALLL